MLNRHALLVALALLVVAGSIGAVAAEKPARTEEPPLLDRNLFFDDPQIAGAQISPDGKWISFRRPYHDVMNIWVKGVNEPFDKARPITADEKRPVIVYFWTEDSRYVLYAQDKGGDENYHVYAVDPKGQAAKDGVPAARDLTPLDGIRAMIVAVPEATPNRILVGLNDRDPAMHDVYSLNLDTAKRDLLITNDANVLAWVPDLAGNVRLAMRLTSDGGTEFLAVENGKLGKVIYSCTFEETCAPERFHKDGKHVYIQSDKGADVDRTRLMLMDATTGTTELVEADPENQVDFGNAIFSDKTEDLVATSYVGDRQRIYPKTPEHKKELDSLRKKLPDGEIDVLSTTEDESVWLVGVTSDVNPGSVYVYDLGKKSTTKLYDSRPDLPSQALATMRPVRYPARDGSQIPAYLTVPQNAAGRKVPTVLLPHGGPWARDQWGYSGIPQFLANRGYAVLQPNFRGSTGYGKKHLNGGNGGWGIGVMQDDLSDAVKYLISSGVSDPQKIAILGGSYGGYATLAGVTFTPDLYAAGVSIVGPSNIITLLDSIPPYWGPMKKMFLKRVGDPSIPEEKARLIEQSPFFHAKQIKAPLLVIQGANDPRVKKAESDQIVVALRDLGRPVEYMVAPDEGHGFQGRDNKIAMFAVVEDFLARQIGGRAQKEMPAEIAQKVGNLRVDVKTVTMPKTVQGVDMARTAPLPKPDPSAVRAGTLSYTTDLKLAGGNEMKIDSKRELASDKLADRSVWRIETTATSPMGEAKDVYYLDAQSLSPVRRSVTQGPINISIDYSEQAIKGTMKLPGQEMPVDVKLDAPVWGNEAALEAVLATLPLALGYKTTMRTFDLQSQKVRVWSVEVKGQEAIDVPAGKFSAFKTSVDALDGEGGGATLWFSAELPRRTVRSEIELPAQMGGGTATSTLTAIVQ
jgi:dipeptidyl aminopeptidase/acylaminoacyl peptidase